MSHSPALSHHVRLLHQLIRRDVEARYRGSVLGLAWSFVIPLLMLGVYTFVFAIVFKARWGDAATGESSTLLFALNLYVGLVLHGFVAENLGRAPTLITSHANYVTKVVFPLGILPPMLLGSALFHLGMNLGVLLLVTALWGAGPSAIWLAIPLVIAPLAILALAANYLLSSLGVYLRDIGQLTGLLITLLMFLSPIFYPVSALPPAYQGWIHYNPLSFPVEWLRALIMQHQWPDAWLFTLYSIASVLVLLVSVWWFHRTRPGFADVL